MHVGQPRLIGKRGCDHCSKCQSEQNFSSHNPSPEICRFSFKPDGSDLPTTAAYERSWVLVDTTPLTENGLRHYTVESKIAVVNLKTRRYHIARKAVIVLQFPAPQHCSV
jgi:hypothetical protein